MRVVADLHIHSKYARATSQRMNLEELELWARKKGISVIATGDITHPVWFDELRSKLKESEPGLFCLSKDSPVRFVLSGEISCIYSKNNRVRKIHIVVIFPDFETLSKFNSKLSWIGNLRADGRPTLGLDVKELVKIAKDTSPHSLVIPAHIWTPWFSLFGSNSGFDSIDECFEEETENITALETGLSSDPPMNWRLSSLDSFSLVSNSDSHSPERIGREANVFELDELSLFSIKEVLENKDKERFLYTIEFFPEEGKYHYDGHRNCQVRLHPKESRKLQNRCPVCHRPLTVGVLHRVEELADRPEGYKPESAIPFKSLIPLDELIAESMGVAKSSVRVKREYERLVQVLGTELEILLERDISEIEEIAGENLALAISNLREGKVEKIPGYDGEYGIIKALDKEKERPEPVSKTQKPLF